MNLTQGKRQEYILLIGFLFFMLSSFISQKIYSVIAPYGTLVMFIILSVIYIMSTIADRAAYIKKDIVTLVGIIAVIITPINLFLLHSGKGAMLVIFDLVLSLTLIIRGMELSNGTKRLITFTGAMLMLVWYPVVRWDYGFNMAGLMFIILLIFGEIFMEYVKDDLGLDYLKYVQILFFFASVLLAICYQARSAALSMFVFAIIYIITPVIIEKRMLYNTCIYIFTLGSIAFTVFYALFNGSGRNMRILYKDVLSGREQIWAELWGEFLRHPLTGIGSSYKLKSLFIFEVHNALFDILVVHGIIVFICVLYLLIRALKKLYSGELLYCPDKRLALAGIFTLLAASFFENGFIVTPYSCVFFVLLLICV